MQASDAWVKAREEGTSEPASEGENGHGGRRFLQTLLELAVLSAALALAFMAAAATLIVLPLAVLIAAIAGAAPMRRLFARRDGGAPRRRRAGWKAHKNPA